MNIGSVFDSVFVEAKSFKFLFRFLGAAFLTLLIFYAFFSFVSPHEVAGILSRVSLPAIVTGFLVYIMSMTFRAARFNTIHPKIPMRTFFSITSVHSILIALLPVRSGELAFPVLLKRVDGTPLISSLTMLFIVRIFDLLAIFTIFFFALAITYGTLDERLRVIMLTLSIVFLIGAAVVSCIIIFGRNALLVARRILFFDGLRNNRATRWVFQRLEKVFEGLHVVRERRSLWRIMLFSFLIWLCHYTAVIMLVRSMGFDLSVWVLALGLTFSMLVSILPINGLGSFGTLEAAWTLIFLGFGAAKEVSFATGFGFHLIITSYLFVFGLFGMVYLFFLKKQDTKGQEKERK